MKVDIIQKEFKGIIQELLSFCCGIEEVPLKNEVEAYLANFAEHYSNSGYYSGFNDLLAKIEAQVASCTIKFHDDLLENLDELRRKKEQIELYASRVRIRIPNVLDKPRSFRLVVGKLWEGRVQTYMKEYHYEMSVRFLSTVLMLHFFDTFQSLLTIESSLGKTLANDKDYLLSVICRSIKRLQGVNKVINNDEPSRTLILSNFIDNFAIAKDESRWGESSSGLKPGETDIKIVNDNQETIAILEAMNLKSINKTKLKEHFEKLPGYDPSVNGRSYLIYFYSNKKIAEGWLKLKEFYMSLYSLEIVDVDMTEIPNFTPVDSFRIGSSNHKDGDMEVNIIHIFVYLND